MNINARQIEALDFNYLDQQETYQYSVNQLARVKANPAIMAILGVEVTAWENATEAFNTAYRKVSTATQTKVVETLDGERDTLYTGFTGTVNNAVKSPIAAQQTAALQVQEPIKRYAIRAGGDYQNQTMRTEQLCSDLLENFSSQLETLGLTAWVEALRAKNNEFNEAMIARTNEQAGYIRAELTQLRAQLIVEYRKFVKLQNVVLIYEGDTAYATTIDQMNAEVRNYKKIIARKTASGSSSQQGGGSSQQGGTSNNGQNGQSGEDNGSGSEQGGGSENGGTTPQPDPDAGFGGGGDNNGGDNGGGGGTTPTPDPDAGFGGGGDNGGGDNNGGGGTTPTPDPDAGFGGS